VDSPSAVVFLGATAGGGPSVDRCCDYFKFFTNHAAATAWTIIDPRITSIWCESDVSSDLGAWECRLTVREVLGAAARR
jgi:hypothetical protein